jgi:hypothetical protein
MNENVPIKPRNAKAIEANKQSAQHRAEYLFDIFLLMGADRSLEKLQKVCAAGGLTIHLNTLKNYSASYKWQERIREANQATQERVEEQRVESLVDMNRRQANLGDLAQRLSGLFISNIFQRLQADPTSVQGAPSDIARLMAEGSKLERLARGEVTDRTEARVHAYTIMVNQIVEVFAGVVRDHGLPQAAVDDFISGADALVSNALSESTVEG